MQFIQLSNIYFTYPDYYQPILEGVNLVISTGEKIALIGVNGSGKTTLLHIIQGNLAPLKGSIIYPTSRPAIAYLSQDVKVTRPVTVSDFLLEQRPEISGVIHRIDELSRRDRLSTAEGLELSELWYEYGARNASDWQQEVNSLLAEMNLDYLKDRIASTLSGGESTRLQIAALLLGHPDIIILDEPTNHMDLKHLEWFEAWLRDYQGAVLYVSHDRVFIDKTATKIAELSQGRLEERSGNYQSFTKDRAELQNHQMDKYLERERLIVKLNEAAQKRRSWAKSYQKETSAEGGGFVYESVYNAARTQMQQARNIEKRIKMLQDRYPVEKPLREKPHSVRFDGGQGGSKALIGISGLSFKYEDEWILQDLYMSLDASDKLWLSGENGSGKTTLLKLMAGELVPIQGEIAYASRLKIGYYQQDLTCLDVHISVLDYLGQVCSDEQQIRTYLGCLGVKSALAFELIGSLSWGERAKIQLVYLLLGDNNVLLLDEPTNHLDIRSREMLEEALEDYKGALVFVSHDRAFINLLSNRIFCLDQKILEIQGGSVCRT